TAIMQAAAEVSKKNVKTIPEIMIPLVSLEEELSYTKKRIIQIIDNLNISKDVEYKIGTMIETPRSALISSKLAKSVEFFSFGSNDLTQMTFGFSRDDSYRFIDEYKEKELLKTDPFKSLDQQGVGELVKLSIKNAKKGNKNIKIGICGEHAGDLDTIAFCNRLKMDYISCSPYRITAALIKAAQSNIKK
ncbi:MAG: putative PEP-binding protein, partial [Candidatus Woesearchaeota archaeon]